MLRRALYVMSDGVSLIFNGARKTTTKLASKTARVGRRYVLQWCADLRHQVSMKIHAYEMFPWGLLENTMMSASAHVYRIYDFFMMGQKQRGTDRTSSSFAEGILLYTVCSFQMA